MASLWNAGHDLRDFCLLQYAVRGMWVVYLCGVKEDTSCLTVSWGFYGGQSLLVGRGKGEAFAADCSD